MAAAQTVALLLANGIEYAWTFVGGDPYVHKARNRLASEFLHFHPGATHLFFIDDDLGWSPPAVLRMLQRDEEIICGVYPKKNDSLEFPVLMNVENDCLTQRGGLYEAKLAPTGFMCLRRAVIERCSKESGEYPEPDTKHGEIQCWDLFRTGFVAHEPGGTQGRWWGEDFFFSAMVRHLGMRIWIDPDIEFTHRGSKAWRANFSDTMKQFIAPVEAA